MIEAGLIALHYMHAVDMHNCSSEACIRPCISLQDKPSLSFAQVQLENVWVLEQLRYQGHVEIPTTYP